MDGSGGNRSHSDTSRPAVATTATSAFAATVLAATAARNAVQNDNPLLQVPEWPPEGELPYEVLRCLVVLPYNIGLVVSQSSSEEEHRKITG